MPNLFQQLKSRMGRRQQLHLVESANLWYQTSVEVCEICGEALYRTTADEDIGVLLDKADRKLFQYRNDAGDAQRAIRRLDSALSQRVALITEQVYELRNQTASFLIRSQGPGPFTATGAGQHEKDAYHKRAMGESGLKARSLKSNLDIEIQAIWVDLQTMIDASNKRI